MKVDCKTMSALIKVLMGRILLFLHAALDGQEATTDSEKRRYFIFCARYITMDKLTLTLGYRSEDYDKVENRWSDAKPTRTIKDAKYNNKKSSGDYSTTGFGATYDVK